MKKTIHTILEDLNMSALIYLAKIISLYQISLKFRDILHYAYNDLTSKYIYSGGYADKGAWLISLSIVFLILSYQQKKQLQVNPNFYQNIIRKRIIEIFLLICFYDLFHNFTKIFHHYLENAIDSTAIMNTVISLMVIIINISFSIVEYKYFSIVTSKKYYPILCFLTITIVGVNLFIVKHFINSDNIKRCQIQFETISMIQKCANNIVYNYNTHYKIPRNYSQFIKSNFLEPSIDISYVQLSEQSFQMCTTVQFDRQTMKKIFDEKNYFNAKFTNIDKGKNCWQFKIVRTDYGDYDLDIHHLDNTTDTDDNPIENVISNDSK